VRITVVLSWLGSPKADPVRLTKTPTDQASGFRLNRAASRLCPHCVRTLGNQTTTLCRHRRMSGRPVHGASMTVTPDKHDNWAGVCDQLIQAPVVRELVIQHPAGPS
jgi:hypothetical protein